MTTIEWFDRYVSQGWDIIPLHPASKRPVFDRWQQGGVYDRSFCRSYVETRPDSNLGLLLGRVVDVEGDSEVANLFLEDLIDDCPHPHYRSHKSIHHLFQSPDPHLTRIAFDDIEFRGYRHHSVVPPSLHEMGSHYRWVAEHGFQAPPMPPGLLKFYMDSKARRGRPRRSGLKPGFVEIACASCRKKVPVHHKRYKLERQAFQDLGQPWSCNACRSVDVRPECRKLKRRP